MSYVEATFVVEGSTYAEGERVLKGLTPDEMADAIEAGLHPGISLCHECAHQISDPQVAELTGFTVDGVSYELAETLGEGSGSTWVKSA